MNGTDEQLYDLYLHEGNEDALLALIKRHRESLVLFLRGYVRSIDDAEELALDAFAEAAAGPTVFSRKSSFRTWLFSIGRNLALKHVRRMRYAAENDAAEHEDAEADPPEMGMLRDERSLQLYEGLSRINADYRRVLILLYFEEMSHEEAAAVMGRSRKQIYHLAGRGRKALKEELLKMGFEYEIGL